MDDGTYVDQYDVDIDGLDASFHDGQFSSREKVNKKTGEVTVLWEEAGIADALEALFDSEVFSQRNDDHHHRDRVNKSGKNEQPGEVEFHEGELTIEDLFGPSGVRC
jgi:hypothetical protein